MARETRLVEDREVLSAVQVEGERRFADAGQHAHEEGEDDFLGEQGEKDGQEGRKNRPEAGVRGEGGQFHGVEGLRRMGGGVGRGIAGDGFHFTKMPADDQPEPRRRKKTVPPARGIC